MPANNTMLVLLANAMRTAITHIALVDDTNAEVGDARKAVTWAAADADGDFVMSGDLEFEMTSGDDVAGWQGYSALTEGTAYGIVALTPVTFSNDGTYTLTAASTGFNIATAADA